MKILRRKSSETLFSNAELAEDEVQDILACCCAGERVEGAKSFREIKEYHFVGNGGSYCSLRSIECRQCCRDGMLLTKICEQCALGVGSIFIEKREDNAT